MWEQEIKLKEVQLEIFLQAMNRSIEEIQGQLEGNYNIISNEFMKCYKTKTGKD